ncbi:phage minor capsid protein [Rhodococcus opacus]|uniref:phage minor capsid protein n=1 Tax=Rhodococcus opacus TaxID=37919 RepID=UPI001C43E17B|nr:phage minor capsid protein [Rhodococcus opacus]MBV6758363.1 phage minor capsid protein [Rhodococcus opacus]
MTAPVPGAPEALASIYADAEARLLAIIAQAVERTGAAPDWAIRQLAEIGQLSAAAQGLLAELNPVVADAIEAALAESAAAGIVAADNEIAEAWQVTPTTLPAAAVDVAAVSALAAETVAVVADTNHAILRNTVDAFRTIVAETTGRTVTGVNTRQQVLQQALDRFAREGIRGFTDSAGRNWRMDTYADMALRTSAFRALTQGHAARLQERGHDLVVVSHHRNPAPQCQPFEGKVLSLSGRTPNGKHRMRGVGGREYVVDVVASVREAEARGLHHPNCRHRYTLYVPGARIPQPEPYDPRGYKNEQKLRYLETQVRASKRLEAVATTPEAAAKARARTRHYQGRIREHVADTGVARKRFREQLREGNEGNAIDPVRVTTIRRPDPPDGGTSTPKKPKDPKPPPGPYDHIDDVDELGRQAEKAIEAGDFDALDHLEARQALLMEQAAKRDAKNAAAREKRAAETAAKQARQDAEFDRLMAAGVDPEEAVARAFGITVEQQRRENAINTLRRQGYDGAGFDELTRNAYGDVVHEEWLAAENELTFLVRKKYEADVDPRDLWKMNEETARKRATPELLEWWDEHGRTTLEGFRENWLGGTQGNTRGGDFLQ